MYKKGSPLHGLTKLHIRIFQNIPAHELRITVPTVLTMMRILLVPCIVAAMFLHAWGWACAFFFAAAVTDFLDGNLARYLHAKTFLGACLDPIADKLLLVSFFATLVFLTTPLFQLPLWFVLLLLAKEIFMIVGALYILMSGRHLDVQPTLLGKLTTAVQMLFIMWLFACYYFQWMPIKTYYSMLALMVVMTLLALGQYVRIGIKQAGLFCCIVSFFVCAATPLSHNSFIKGQPQRECVVPLRKLKQEYGSLFAQQLRLSTALLQKIGQVQLTLAHDVHHVNSSYNAQCASSLHGLHKQLEHLRALGVDASNGVLCALPGDAQLVTQLAHMVEQIACIQHELLVYVEQLVEGDDKVFCKKRQSILEREISVHRTDVHVMQSLLELLQQLEKECKVVQKSI